MDKNIIDKIRRIEIKDIIYPAFTIFAFLIFITFFILSVLFLLNSINKAFGINEEEYKIVRFDIEGFNKVVSRLGIKIE